MHLHNHTEYSLLDGANRIDELVALAAQMQMPALAITDHGVLYGTLPFYRAAKKAGIKPIIGCEVYVAPRGRTERDPKLDANPYHLVLLAKDETGYRNLLALSSLGFLEGFYYRPRVDKELLSKHSQGLIALSACLGGEIPHKLLAQDFEGAQEAAREYLEIFGQENFFLELQDQNLEGQPVVNQGLIQLGKELGIGLVATNDTHYLRREDAQIHDVLLCIQTGKTLAETDRMRFETDEFYLKSPQEMEALFSHVPEALSNTLEIANRCHFELELGDRHLPRFPLPEGTDAAGFLRQLATDGARKRYGEISEDVRARLEHELGIIEEMGFCDYFLIVWDFVRFAKNEGIAVGPGRGSAAGSLVAYSLGITELDPLKWGLLFERFLNPERISMPDIDIDFCIERRSEVLAYVSRRYGEDHVAQIITFGTLAAKSAVRDVGRVLDLPLGKVDRLAKLIPGNTPLLEAAQEEEKLKAYLETDPELMQLVQIAARIEGFPRNASTHAAGVVITDEPLMECTPLRKDREGPVITQYPMGDLEDLGLLKMDFLGLRNLTVIQKAQALAGGIDLEKIPLDDPKVFQMLSRGDSLGVFQLESRMFQELLRQVQPRELSDLVAIVSLGRPGPLSMVPEYVKGKEDPESIRYLDPALEPILKETYGIMVYQEQVMQIASALAGFSLAEADLLRRAMGKKRPEEIASLKERFITGAAARGIEEERALKIFRQIEDFAGYGFNKSHAAAYALIAYQTAYLRTHYQVPYMAALLSSEKNDLKKLSFYMNGCRKMGIEILPPDVNTPDPDFTVEGEQIRFGLSAVKNVGLGAVAAIIEARQEGPFTTLADLCARVDLRTVNRRVLESLIRVGACDTIYPNRRALLLNLDEALRFGETQRKLEASGQGTLFDNLVSPPPMPGIDEFSPEDLLAFEKEYLGFFLSGHPLDPWEELLGRLATPLLELNREGRVVVGGMLGEVREFITRKGERMAYATLEDYGASIELVIFPRLLPDVEELLAPEAVVLALGRFQSGEGNQSSQILVDRLIPLRAGFCLFTFPGAGGRPRQLAPLLAKIPGELPLGFEFQGGKRQIIQFPKENWWLDVEGLLELDQKKWPYELLLPAFGKEN